MATKNLPARPAYESLIAMMQVHREYHPKGGAYLAISTETIDALIAEHAAFAVAQAEGGNAAMQSREPRNG